MTSSFGPDDLGPGPMPGGSVPPAEPPVPDGSRPRQATRPKAPMWNRTRLILLLGVMWLIVVWGAMADNPLLPFVDAVRSQRVEAQWLLWLMGLELVRQIHYVVCERSP